MSLVGDDLAAWLIGLLADAGRKRLTTWILGTEQERALRQAGTSAVLLAASELRPEDGEQAEELVRVVSHVFKEPVLNASLWARATLLEVLQAGIAGQLAVLDDVSLTGVGQSSAQVLGLPVTVLAEKLTGHLIREIVIRGSRGGPLEPLAAQLNHDVTHLQGQRLEQMVTHLTGEVREALAQIGPATVSSHEVRYSLPPDVEAFTGREKELDTIARAVIDAPKAGRVVAIHAIDGMPGVGKTALAVRAARLLRARFPDRQLFLDLHAHTPGQVPISPGAALAVLLTAIGVDARSLPEDTEGRASLWRDRMSGQRALVVLDNAASSAQVAPLLPGGEGCMVLVTSRRHLADMPGTAVPLLLETLPPEKAKELFRRLAPRAALAPAASVAELMRLAGHLPLAISLLARVYDRHPSWTLPDLTTESRASMLTLTAERDSVAAAFEVSYQYLTTDRQEFFRFLGLHPGTTIDAYAAAALVGVTMQEATRQLDALHGEGLLIEVGYRRYGMHDLIRRYTQDLVVADSAASREQALERLLDYYQYTAAVANSYLARQTRTSFDPAVAVQCAVPDLPDLAHALAWVRTERPNLLACLDHVASTRNDVRVVSMTAVLAAVLRHDGPWADAIAAQFAAVQAARHLGDLLGQANALSELGIVRQLTGDYPGALQAQQEALGIYRDLGERLGIANAFSEVGAVRRLAGDYLDAVEALEEALGFYRDLGERLGQANALNDLGGVRYLADNYPGAVQALEEAVSIYRDLGHQLGLASALSNLGAARQLAGDYLGSVEALEEGLGISRDLGNRLSQANILIHLGGVQQQTGNLPAAAEALEEGLRIARDLGNRLGQANALLYQGVVLRLTGDFAGAARDLEEALSIYRDLGDRSGEVMIINETGTLNRVRGDLSRATTCHQQALDLAREYRSSWDEAHALAGLGRCSLAVGHIADAEEGLRQALEIFQRIGSGEAEEIAAELNALTETGPAHQGL